MYVALIYVGHWTPGEIIDEALTEAQAERLLKMGAIRRTDAPEAAAPAPEADTPEAEAAEEADAPKAEAAEEADALEAEDAEEVEAPVIDVADTLATAPSAPKKKGGRRK